MRLQKDAWGRLVVWLAQMRGVGGESSACAFGTRTEAIRWAKFEAHYYIDFSQWAVPQGDYPNETARDDERLDPTFIATWGHSTQSQGGQVTVTKTVICGVFDWAADKNWDRAFRKS